MDDDALTDAWERGEQLPGGISHEQHVRIAWVLLRRHERAVAVRRILAGTERACAVHGVPEKFDRALTLRWIHAIAEALDRDGDGGAADQFLAAHPELGRGKLGDGARACASWFVDPRRSRYVGGVAGWREDRIRAALRGANPMVMARMRSGFAVIGDTQHLPGYSVLLCDDATINHLTDLDGAARVQFLLDVSLLGEAVKSACDEYGLRRINYEILGNADPYLHAHVHARYDWEPAERIRRPVSQYPEEVRNAPEHAYRDDVHGPLRVRITAELDRLCAATPLRVV